jgi:hypothetical protein
LIINQKSFASSGDIACVRSILSAEKVLILLDRTSDLSSSPRVGSSSLRTPFNSAAYASALFNRLTKRLPLLDGA